MGSYYIGERRPVAAAGYGPVFLTFEELARQWKKNDQTLRVLVRERYLSQFTADIDPGPRQVMKLVENYRLVTNR
jgi:hypothetical protein